MVEEADYYFKWGVLSFFTLYSFFYFNKLNECSFYSTLTLASIILSLIGYYQFFSGYQYIVGIYDNPAGFSCTLVCLLPFIYKLWRDSRNLLIKYFLGIIIVSILIVIILSESRTAIISIIVISSLLIPKKHLKKVLIIGITLIPIIIFFIKSESSYGRIFILLISIKMINIDTILYGNGSGFFKNQYMIFQSEYFKNTTNEKYTMTADNIFHPMNEYLLFIIEHGIILFAILIMLLIFYIKKTDKNTPEFLSFISILIISLFSYPFKYPIILLITSYNLATLRLTRNINIKYKLINKLILILSFSFWIIYICYDSYNNYIWKQQNEKCKLGKVKEAQETYSKLYNYMSNNPDFLYNYSSILFNQKKYEKSLYYAIETNKILNNYETQLLLADNFRKLKKYNESLSHYKESSYMCPNRFIPLYGIFNIYKETKDYKKMDSIRYIILNKKIKIRSSTIDNIIYKVKKNIEKEEE